MMPKIRPIIAGIGQIANRDEERVAHPGELLQEAARLALSETSSAVLPHIGAVYSTPLSVFSDASAAELVAEALELGPGPRKVDPGFSGTGPLYLLDDACQKITAGELDAVLLVGGVADASVRRARAKHQEPPAPPGMPLSLGTERTGTPGRPSNPGQALTAESQAGVSVPAAFFALAESRIAAEMGHDPRQHREYLGGVLSRFTEVAARHPDLAWFPQVRQPAEISGVDAGNRLVAEPYTKLMCSFPTVDLAAAVIVVSDQLAGRLGIPESQWIFPWGIGRSSELQPLAERRVLHRSRILSSSIERLLTSLEVSIDQIAAFDFYSCFPAAFQFAANGFALRPTDTRALTVTGGMPYFGGPGASYGLHGLATMIEFCRANPGSIGAVYGLGGMLEKFAVGVLSNRASDKEYRSEYSRQDGTLADTQRVQLTPSWEGPGTVFAGTVLHDRDDGPIAAPVIVDLPDGTRIGARARSQQVAQDLSDSTLVGLTVRLSTSDGHVSYEPT
jgi:acetyl-CoA C-acetyltransferase